MNTTYLPNRAVLVVYPPNAGGKFLINCLGLSCKAVLQDIDLINQQLQGLLTPKNKYDLLINRLKNVKDTWNDLQLGNAEYCNNALSLRKEMNHRGWYLFYWTHVSDPDALQPWLRRLHDPILIKLDNYDKFVKTYRKNQSYWNRIRGDDWPDEPKTMHEYNKLPLWIRQELEVQFEDHFRSLYLPDFGDTDFQIRWNCDWYLSEKTVVDSMKNLYEKLGLDDFNAEWIASYWRLWTETLTRLEHKS